MTFDEAVTLVQGEQETMTEHATMAGSVSPCNAISDQPRRLDLANMHALLDYLGNPEKSLHFIHVAGTNGKGSVCAMLSSICREAGLRTGLYISPHLKNVNERISINGVDISDSDLESLALMVRDAYHATNIMPGKFEIFTLIGLLYFKKMNCDIVILEVGLGGRLDATNAIPVPDVACITEIGLDHTELLGDTLDLIAFEKAGIIKHGGHVVTMYQKDPSGRQDPLQVFKTVADERNAYLTITDPSSLRLISQDLDGQVFDYKDRLGLKLSLLGPYQLKNCMVALDAIDMLNTVSADTSNIGKHNFNISDSAIRAGLSHVAWPGRFEVVNRNPLVIVDGAHNPNGVEALRTCIESTILPLNKSEIIFLMGVMADKDYNDMLSLIAPYATRFIVEAPGTSRALTPTALESAVKQHFTGSVRCCPSVSDALNLALETAKKDSVIICFGSLYQVSEIRDRFIQ